MLIHFIDVTYIYLEKNNSNFILSHKSILLKLAVFFFHYNGKTLKTLCLNELHSRKKHI